MTGRFEITAMSDSRAQLQRASDKLLAEEYRLEAWRHRVAESRDVPAGVVAIDKRLQEILEDVAKQIQRAESSTLLGLALRTLTGWLGDALGGRVFVEDELRTCGQLNDALEAYALKSMSDQVDASTSMLSGATSTLEERTRGMDAKVTELHRNVERLYKQLSSRPGITTIDRGTMAGEDEVDSKPKHPHISLKASYSVSVQGLDILSRGIECKDFQELSSRLQVWGVGLFDGPLSLDQIFEYEHAQQMGSDAYLQLLVVGYNLMSTTFMRILLNLEYMLAHLDFGESVALTFLDDAEALLNSLQRPNVLEYASIGIVPSAEDEESLEGRIFRCATNVHENIESLYGLLPAIGTMRNLCCSHEEQMQKDPRKLYSEWSQGLGNVFEKDVDQSLLAKETLQLAQALDPSLPVPPPSAPKVPEPETILKHPPIENRKKELKISIKDAPFLDIDPGVFNGELVKLKIYAKPDPRISRSPQR